MNKLIGYFEDMLAEDARKFILSKPATKDGTYKRIVVEGYLDGFQAAKYTQTQVFHENLPKEALAKNLAALTADCFLQVNAWSDEREFILLISKKGSVTYKKKASQKEKLPIKKEHNRKKQYLLNEGEAIAPLVDLGVFTKEGMVVRTMYDKFRQINRFLELLDDELKNWPQREIHVLDFGCGKSYLTFIIYHYLTEIRGLTARIVGLDLKAEVIKNCNELSKKYGYTGLTFAVGDINGYTPPFDVDLVLTLHACDTATDYALFNAISWKAKLIYSVPCCQHELNRQLATEQFGILARHGLIKDRFCALATDSIRANLLEACGYKTQVLEFVDLAHTPKNLLIRAVRRDVTPGSVKKKALEEVYALTREFHFQPTLLRLLGFEE